VQLCAFSLGVLKQEEMAIFGSKKGNPMSNCGKKMAIALVRYFFSFFAV
jgi:hypothetical protein